MDSVRELEKAASPPDRETLRTLSVPIVDAILAPAATITSGLDVALSLAGTISGISEGMQYNRKQLRRMADSASELVASVRDAIEELGGDEMDCNLMGNVNELVEVLRRVVEVAKDHSSEAFITRLRNRMSNRDRLDALSKDFNELYARFSLVGSGGETCEGSALIKSKRPSSHDFSDMNTFIRKFRNRSKSTVLSSLSSPQTIHGRSTSHLGSSSTLSLARSSRSYNGPRWFVRRREVDLMEKIDSGGFSGVYKGVWKTKQMEVAIKVFKEESSVDDLINEMVFWLNLKHPFVLPFLGGAPLERPAFTISPLCKNGNAIQYLRTNGGADKMLILHDVARGMEYLHKSDVVHGDLKAKNVLIDGNGRGLVADFGFAKYERLPIPDFRGTQTNSGNAKMVALVGTPHWLAPECFLDGEINKSSDVWAFGMTAYELFTNGEIPLGHVNDKLLGRHLNEGLRPTRFKNGKIPDSAWSLMQNTWQQLSTSRPPFSELSLALSIYQQSDTNALKIASKDLERDMWASRHWSRWSGLAVAIVEIVNKLRDQLISFTLDEEDQYPANKANARDGVLAAFKILLQMSKTCRSQSSTRNDIVRSGVLQTLLAGAELETSNSEIFCLVCEIVLILVDNIESCGGSVAISELVEAFMKITRNSSDPKQAELARATAQSLLSADLSLAYIVSMEQTENTDSLSLFIGQSSESKTISEMNDTTAESLNLSLSNSESDAEGELSFMRFVALAKHRMKLVDLDNQAIGLDQLRAANLESHENDLVASLINYSVCTKEAWRCFAQGAPISPSVIDQVFQAMRSDFSGVIVAVKRVLDDPALYRQVLSSSSENAQILLDLFQDILDLSTSMKSARFRSLVRKALVRLSQTSGLHPRCLVVDDLKLIGSHPITGGSFADVWQGTVSSTPVAVKILRVFKDSDKKSILRDFLNEAMIWGQINSPYLLPFYGMYQLSDERLCLLSPWMSNGNVVDFLKNQSITERPVLCHDVAHGVAFLHREKIVHGDLKGLNILITPNGRACISDFGLCNLVESQARVWTSLVSKPVKGGTPRWQAPELFENRPNSFSSDIYALGMVFYEILTDEIPYGPSVNDVNVMLKVIGGTHPMRPEDKPSLTDGWWTIMLNCWNKHSENRPKADEIVRKLHFEMDLTKCCPAPLWNNNHFAEARALRQEFPLRPTLWDIKRTLGSDFSINS